MITAETIASEIDKHGPAIELLQQQHPQLAILLTSAINTSTPEQLAEFLAQGHSPVADATEAAAAAAPADGGMVELPSLPGVSASAELPAACMMLGTAAVTALHSAQGAATSKVAADSAIDALPATLKMPDVQQPKHMPLFQSSEQQQAADGAAEALQPDAAELQAAQADQHCCTIADLLGIAPRPRPVRSHTYAGYLTTSTV